MILFSNQAIFQVRPVCLPRSRLEQTLPDLALSGDQQYYKTGVVAGWGLTGNDVIIVMLLMGDISRYHVDSSLTNGFFLVFPTAFCFGHVNASDR